MQEKPSLANGNTTANRPISQKLFKASLLCLAVISTLAIWSLLPQRSSKRDLPFLDMKSFSRAANANLWSDALNKIKEDRGEPVGKQAKVEIPSELRHYGDTRRFLAVQVAEVKQHHVETPTDLVELARMVNRGEFVTLPTVTENYILFGVGGKADTEPFTRYQRGKKISIYDEAGVKKEYERIASSRAQIESSIGGLKKELSTLRRRDRSRRRALQSQIASAQKSLQATAEEKETLDRTYGDSAMRSSMFADYEFLTTMGRSFANRSFDISEAAARRQMKVRLLSSLRPEAAKVLDEVATAYREKFDRPLPITSLVRPDEYQHDLSKTNPNATLIDTPPHSTGLAFDVFYGYMTAEEQEHVMSHLAQLKDAGRIEVLRENRNHYHVFAFVDGSRPTESLIASSIANRSARKVVQETHANHAKKKTTHAKKIERKNTRSTKSKSRPSRKRR